MQSTADELWTTMGHLYKGGMWFKKQAYISGYNSNTAVDGTDWRTASGNQSWPASRTLPSAADAGKYFYLPASGSYFLGRLHNVGSYGYYWLSSADPRSRDDAYDLYFGNAFVAVLTNNRGYGFRVGGFE